MTQGVTCAVKMTRRQTRGFLKSTLRKEDLEEAWHRMNAEFAVAVLEGPFKLFTEVIGFIAVHLETCFFIRHVHAHPTPALRSPRAERDHANVAGGTLVTDEFQFLPVRFQNLARSLRGILRRDEHAVPKVGRIRIGPSRRRFDRENDDSDRRKERIASRPEGRREEKKTGQKECFHALIVAGGAVRFKKDRAGFRDPSGQASTKAPCVF